jgi:hypothetical protein
MPTTLNIPKMSDEDESLMWEILDLSSSSGRIEMTDQTLSPPDRDMGIEDLHAVEQPPLSDVEDIDHPSEILSPGATQLHTQIAEVGSEYSMRGWPFATRNDGDDPGEGIPGIPDWMLLDDYMTERL